MKYQEFLNSSKVPKVYKSVIKDEIQKVSETSGISLENFADLCEIDIHEEEINSELRNKLEWESPINENSAVWIGVEILSDTGYGKYHIWKESE